MHYQKANTKQTLKNVLDLLYYRCRTRDGNSSENFTPGGIKEWQFNIPRGSWKIKSIPEGPRGILRNDMLLNLQLYYKKSQYSFFDITQFSNSLKDLTFLDLF